MAPQGARAAAKRKRQRPPNDDNSDDDIEILQVYAPGTAPPPRPKRQQRLQIEETKQNDTNAGDQQASGANTEPTGTSLKPEGQVLEVGYMSTTRAVIGHGFQVCELLFADEFASLHITNWIGGDPTMLCEMIDSYALRKKLHGGFKRIVHHVDRANAGAMTLHLVNKQVARRVFTSLSTSDAMAIEPIHSNGIVKDEVFERAKYTSRIKITWADGVATGGGRIFFADVGAANAFLDSYYRNRTELTACPVSVIGIPVQDDAEIDNLDEDEMLERVLELSQYDRQPWLPPLRKGQVDQDPQNDQIFFDHVKIGGMTARQLDQLEFCVKIVDGLPLDVDEVRLEELVAPHKIVHCKVKRVQATGRRPSERLGRQRRAMPLTWLLNPNEVAEEWKDELALRVGTCVHFENYERMERIYAAALQSPFWTGMVSPLGQPVRLGMEHVYSVLLPLGVYKYFCYPILAVRSGLVNKPVWCTLDKKADDENILEVKFGSNTRDALDRVVMALEEVIECEKITDESLTCVLFSRAGRAKVREWVASRKMTAGVYAPAYARLVDEDKSIWVYGGKFSREEGFASLRKLAVSIQNDVEIVDRIARVDLRTLEGSASAPSSIDDDGRPCLMVQPVLRDQYHCSVADNVSRISVSGATQQLEDRLAAWEHAGCFMDQDELAQMQTRPDCSVCMMQADEPVVKFTLCGHTFCHECIQPGLSSSNRLPLVCPTPNCGSSIHVKDAAKITKDVKALVDTAVFDYVAKHPSDCVVCPKSGCNQILSRAFIEPGKIGGEQFAYCDNCAKSYCLTCSAATSSAMERHDNSSCDDFQAVGGAAGDRFVRYIRDQIFTLSCPQCKSAFLDFDGCTSVACGNVTCRQYFCANCLDYSSASSATTHAHVLQCPKNPLPGRYHVPAESLVTVHRARRTAQLRDYLVAQIPSADARRVVLSRLSKDMADLGIAVTNDLLTATAATAAPAPQAPPAAARPAQQRRPAARRQVPGLPAVPFHIEMQEMLAEVDAQARVIFARMNQRGAPRLGQRLDQADRNAEFNVRLPAMLQLPALLQLPAFLRPPAAPAPAALQPAAPPPAPANLQPPAFPQQRAAPQPRRRRGAPRIGQRLDQAARNAIRNALPPPPPALPPVPAAPQPQVQRRRQRLAARNAARNAAPQPPVVIDLT